MGGEVGDKPNSSQLLSVTELLNKMCPIYLSWGMPLEEFWHGELHNAIYYRKAAELKSKQANEIAWLNGLYTYIAICKASPLFNPFAKTGTKPAPYLDKPLGEKEEKVDDEQARSNRLMNLKNVLEAMSKKKR